MVDGSLTARSGSRRIIAAALCTVAFVALLVGVGVVIVRAEWALLPPGLVSVAFWGWIAWSLWAPRRIDTDAIPLDEDPGWPLSAVALLTILPGAVRWYMRRDHQDGLLATRTILIGFTAALVLFGSVLARLSLESGPVVPWVPILAVVAVYTSFTDRMARSRLDFSSAERLAQTYRLAFFLHVAFGMSVALFGFVMSFGLGPAWIYYPAAAISITQLWSGNAPTRRGLERLEVLARRRGFTGSVIAAIRRGATV